MLACEGLWKVPFVASGIHVDTRIGVEPKTKSNVSVLGSRPVVPGGNLSINLNFSPPPPSLQGVLSEVGYQAVLLDTPGVIATK